ncbi:Uma2 family endonuclease [Streptomyces oceani]|uniref:Putative restriction endonuclease domain-containing protein n=1 Tax=Streptomyces oceani TaxID=1075402 RepID=A0A1E7KG51_9ACTN|nr:Uma2 family endonuclease [Streptomyces oceani]OEV02907.1 hypothetical protein AN216_14620 [Streptomyces oceani]
MSAAAVERPCDGERGEGLLRQAQRLRSELPAGYRVEIIGGQITVTPPPDGPHAEALTDLTFALAELHGAHTRVLQGAGVWLPGGPADFAVPDLSVVDADYREHLRENNCYDPIAFRMVIEVTSTNSANDLRAKVVAYAVAGIPLYLIVDRKHSRLHVLSDPHISEYRGHRVHAPGEHVTLPGSVSAAVTLSVTSVLHAGS